MLTDWIGKYTGYLLPKHCDLCGLLIERPYSHPIVCRICLDNMTRQSRCLRCGLIVPVEAEQCGRCLVSPPPWSRLYCVGDYQQPLSNYIHRLKYSGQFWHARTLALLLTPHLRKTGLDYFCATALAAIFYIEAITKASIWLGKLVTRCRSTAWHFS